MEPVKPKLEAHTEPLIQSESFRLRQVALPAILYAMAFDAAEVVTYQIKDFAGIIFYFAILLSLIILSATHKNEAERKLWMALGLVPFIRIVSLTIPLAEITRIFWYILIAIPILAAIFIISRNLKFSLNDIGLNGNTPAVQILVALSGGALALVDYFILKPEPLNAAFTFQSTLGPALILLIATGFTEELAFRGVMQRTAIALSPWGWLYIALVYALLQIGQGSIMHFVFAFGVGIFYGFVVKKTGSILGVVLSHGLLNIVLFLILPHLF